MRICAESVRIKKPHIRAFDICVYYMYATGMTKAFRLRVQAFKLFFYWNEGPRVHVHIKHKNGNEIKIWLDDFTIAENKGFKKSEFADLIKLARKYERKISSN